MLKHAPFVGWACAHTVWFGSCYFVALVINGWFNSLSGKIQRLDNRSRSKCFDVQPVTCLHLSVCLYSNGLYYL